MNSHEATERLCISILEKLSAPERQAVLRCARELEKVMKRAGNLGIMALSVLAVQVQAGKKPGEFVLNDVKPEAPAAESNPPTP